ncbi:unnamed protein product [Protopolystoma xenopodis]|uniref:Uncharacterized protein n=1 Tax=Protopolystoma xenopodis TaxID=117903 RepID=A0A3S4ZZX8_9PLAT|nr:unnamed protein product [Protopolystoma xenopodis]
MAENTMIASDYENLHDIDYDDVDELDDLDDDDDELDVNVDIESVDPDDIIENYLPTTLTDSLGEDRCRISFSQPHLYGPSIYSHNSVLSFPPISPKRVSLQVVYASVIISTTEPSTPFVDYTIFEDFEQMIGIFLSQGFKPMTRLHSPSSLLPFCHSLEARRRA